MGDMADWINDDSEECPHWGPNLIQCAYCGKDGLIWIPYKDGYRLCEGGNPETGEPLLHTCKEYLDAKE